MMANVGVLPQGAPELGVVYKFILPLAIPMLLFSANLRSVRWVFAPGLKEGQRVRLSDF